MIVFLARSLVTAKATMLATLTCQVCDEDATVDHLATPQNSEIAASSAAGGNEPSPTDPIVASPPPQNPSNLPVESRKSSTSKASVISAKKPTLKKPTRRPPTKKSFEDRLEELKRYKQRNNNCYVPMINNEGERSLLSEWCRNIRSGRIKCTPEQRQKLDEVGFHWVARKDHDWHIMFNQLKAYKEEYGDCLVPWGWEKDTKLSDWVCTQRKFWSTGNKRGRMREDRKALLDSIGFVWRPNEVRRTKKPYTYIPE